MSCNFFGNFMNYNPKYPAGYISSDLKLIKELTFILKDSLTGDLISMAPGLTFFNIVLCTSDTGNSFYWY